MGNPSQPELIPTPEIVGNAFVHQYYMVLAKNPSIMHRFYQDNSQLGRPKKDGEMSITTGTLEDIDRMIQSLNYQNCSVEITSVDSQESHSGGVMVLVIGYLIASESSRQKFTQSFFLAPQDKGYFVLNDVFRFVDDDKSEQAETDNKTQTPSRQDSLVVEDHKSMHSNETNEEEPYLPSNPIEETTSVANVVRDSCVADLSDDGNTNTEKAYKKSYASILKVAKDVPSLKAVSKCPIKENPTSDDNDPRSDTLVSSLSLSSSENLNLEDPEGESTSVYIKGLPLDANISFVQNEYSKFGPIKPNGVQVIHRKTFCYGFVEFEGCQSMQAALQASPMLIGGFRVIVEEKKSTSRVGNYNRMRYSNGSYYRARGNFNGGRYYNRNDFGNRRSGYPTRGGGDGYRRNDRVAGNGNGRPNSGNALEMNVSGRNMTTVQRVSAAA